MKDIHFEDAFAPVPASVHARVKSTLQEVVSVNPKGVRISRVLVFAALFLLILGGGAIAAVRGGVLDYLFGMRETPTAQQQAMVQPILVRGEAAGASVTVEDALFDGQRLHLGLAISADDPVWAEVASLMVDGEEAPLLATDCLNRMIDGDITGGLTAQTKHAVSGNAWVTLTIRIKSGDMSGESARTELGRVELPFPLTVNTLTWELRMQPGEFAANIRPMVAVWNDLRTAITLHIWPRESGMPRAEIERIFRNFRFFDEKRQLVIFQDTWHNQQCEVQMMDYDAWVYVVECEMPAWKEMPETLWMVPCDSEDTPLWDFAIPFSTESINAENG